MKYPIPKSYDAEWQQDMLREIDRTLDVIVDDFNLNPKVDELLCDVRARIAALREYSGY